MNLEKERLCRGLREAITMLCKTGLQYDCELSVEGLLGITLDRNQVFLVSIKETVSLGSENEEGVYCGDEDCEDVLDCRADPGERIGQGLLVEGDDNISDGAISESRSKMDDTTSHSSRRKSRPLNRSNMSGKAPRKSSTPSQIIQGHVVEPNGTPAHSTKPSLSGGIRLVNMNRHILKVPTTHNLHCKQDAKSSFVDDQPVNLQKPKNRSITKVTEVVGSETSQTDAVAMKHAYHNSSPYSSQFDPIEERTVKKTNADNERTNSVLLCMERTSEVQHQLCSSDHQGIVSKLDPSYKSSHDAMDYDAMADMQEEPIALTCDGTQSSSSSLLTNSTDNSPKPDVESAADEIRKRAPSTPYSIEGVLIKPEPADLDDLQNCGALNCSPIIKDKQQREKKCPDANSTIASLLKAGHGLMGIPIAGYIPPAIPYALDFTGAERSQVTATDLSMMQASESGDVMGSVLASTATGSNSGSEADGKDPSRGRSLSGSLNRRSGVMCSNCGTSVTTMWRRSHEGLPICNPCGLYYKLHNVERPLSLVRGQIYSRKRKPKSYKQESCKYVKSESGESQNNTMEMESQGDSSSST